MLSLMVREITHRFNPEMLVLVRESNGLTQSKLSSSIGCMSQAKISKIEEGVQEPTDNDILQICNYFEKPSTFFFQASKAKVPNITFFRKRSSFPLKTLKYVDANMNIRRLIVEKLGQLFPLEGNPPFYDASTFSGDGSQVAKILRKEWNIQKGPIDDLASLVEAKGIPIVMFDFGYGKLDGLTIRTESGFPIIFLNPSFPPSRLRFTLAHELGHVVMHKEISPEMEQEASEFAGEFLMPEEDCKDSFYPVDIHKLIELKKQWGLSMQAILKNGQRIKKINDRYARFLWMQIGKQGFRKSEPSEDEIPLVAPKLVTKLLEAFFTQYNGKEEDMLCSTRSELKKAFSI